MTQLVNAAYEVEVQPTSSWGLLRGLWERVRTLVGGAEGAVSTTDGNWRRRVAEDMIQGLSERRLAKTISTQVGKLLYKN